MKKKNVISLYEGLQAVGDLKGPNFTFAVARTRRSLAPIIESLEEARKPSKEFQDFNRERIALAKSHAIKLENGDPKTTKTVVNGHLQEEFVIECRAKFDADFDKLKKKYKKALDETEKQEMDYIKSLEEDVEVKLEMVKREDVPEDISSAQLEGILPIVQE